MQPPENTGPSCLDEAACHARSEESRLKLWLGDLLQQHHDSLCQNLEARLKAEREGLIAHFEHCAREASRRPTDGTAVPASPRPQADCIAAPLAPAPVLAFQSLDPAVGSQPNLRQAKSDGALLRTKGLELEPLPGQLVPNEGLNAEGSEPSDTPPIASQPTGKAFEVLNALELPKTSETSPPEASQGVQTEQRIKRLLKQHDVKQSESFLDIAVTALIIANAGVLFAQAQWKGWEAGRDMDLIETAREDSWANAAVVFHVFDHIFNAAFLLELFTRVHIIGWRRYIRDPLNMFDVAVVLATSIDAYILQPTTSGDGSLGIGMARLVRVFRMARIFRVVRIVRIARKLSQLRIIFSALVSCISPLGWSLLILGIMILGCGIIIAQTVIDFVVSDADASMEDRAWVYEYYGDAARASYTLFEAAFSGSWPMRARPLITLVSPWFALFWIVFQVVIAFAVLRVLGAVFLSETLKAANSDAELMVMSKLKEKEEFAAKLREFFLAADTSGDGRLSLEELQAMLDDPGVMAWLKVLELEIYEVLGLFKLLDDNADGTVSYEEFLGGAVRLKGNARAIDSILIMHEQHKMNRTLRGLRKKIEAIDAYIDASGSIARTASASGSMARTASVSLAQRIGLR